MQLPTEANGEARAETQADATDRPGTHRPDVLVLGAGPTGLSVGLGVALNSASEKVLVIEKGSTVGGLGGSFAWKEHRIDYGPHRLSPNLLTVRALVDELLGPDCLVQFSQHGVQFAGRLYQFPPRVLDWLHPAPHYHLLGFTASFLAAKLRWIVRRFRSDTFETTVVRKFGRRFYQRVVAPMAAKVWTDPATIDPFFVHERFAQIQLLQILKKILLPKQELNPSTFFYPRLGFQQLWDAMSDLLRRERHHIWLKSQPVALEVKDNRVVKVTLATPRGEVVLNTADIPVVSTVPLTVLVRLLRGFDTRSLDDKLTKIKYRSMLLAAFEFSQPRTLPYRTLIFPEARYCFNRLFEQNEYSRETVSAGSSVVVADITLPQGDPRFNEPDAEVLARVERDLRQLRYVAVDRITDRMVKRLEYAYAVPDLESRRAMAAVLHEIKPIANLHLLGRFAVGEYDNSDYAIDNGLQCGTLLTGRISRLEYVCKRSETRGRSIVG